MIPHDYVTLYVFGSVNESKDTISQCARCGTTKHDYEYDGGKRSPNYPMFHRRAMAVEEGDCTRGDMTEERAAMASVSGGDGGGDHAETTSIAEKEPQKAVNHMETSEARDQRCPSCRIVLRDIGKGRWHCVNPDCDTIEVRIARPQRTADAVVQPYWVSTEEVTSKVPSYPFGARVHVGDVGELRTVEGYVLGAERCWLIEVSDAFGRRTCIHPSDVREPEPRPSEPVVGVFVAVPGEQPGMAATWKPIEEARQRSSEARPNDTAASESTTAGQAVVPRTSEAPSVLDETVAFLRSFVGTDAERRSASAIADLLLSTVRRPNEARAGIDRAQALANRLGVRLGSDIAPLIALFNAHDEMARRLEVMDRTDKPLVHAAASVWVVMAWDAHDSFIEGVFTTHDAATDFTQATEIPNGCVGRSVSEWDVRGAVPLKPLPSWWNLAPPFTAVVSQAKERLSGDFDWLQRALRDGWGRGYAAGIQAAAECVTAANTADDVKQRILRLEPAEGCSETPVVDREPTAGEFHAHGEGQYSAVKTIADWFREGSLGCRGGMRDALSPNGCKLMADEIETTFGRKT